MCFVGFSSSRLDAGFSKSASDFGYPEQSHKKPNRSRNASLKWNFNYSLGRTDFSFVEEGLKKEGKRGEGRKAATIKLSNERGMISISEHPEAEQLEEQHLNVQHLKKILLFAWHWLLFEL
jgi:hypothetical protein